MIRTAGNLRGLLFQGERKARTSPPGGKSLTPGGDEGLAARIRVLRDASERGRFDLIRRTVVNLSDG